MSSSPSIYGFPNPAAGTPAGPTAFGDFGLGGAIDRLSHPGPVSSGRAGEYGYGLPSSMDPHTNIELEGHSTIPASYVCPPLPDMGDLLLAPLIPSFAVTEKLDPTEGGANTGLTLVASLPQANKLLRDQWNDHVLQSTGDENTNPHYDSRAATFRHYMREYGESLLWAYANAYHHKHPDLLARYAGVPGLKEYYEMSCEDGFCYLTTYGILKKLNFLGIILSTNRADSGYDSEYNGLRDEFTYVAMAMARRAECLQIFGSNAEAVKGSTVYLVLKRAKCGPEYKEGTYGRFIIQPMASASNDFLTSRCSTFLDESGRLARGHVWKIGTVIDPAQREPSLAAQEKAIGAYTNVSPTQSYNAQGILPSFYLALNM